MRITRVRFADEDRLEGEQKSEKGDADCSSAETITNRLKWTNFSSLE